MKKKIKIKFSKLVDYLGKNKFRVLFLLAILVGFESLSYLPYVGLIFSLQNRVIILWIISLWVLNLSPKYNFLASLLSLLVALISVLQGKTVVAEAMGVVAFVLLGVGVLQCFWEFINKKSNYS